LAEISTPTLVIHRSNDVHVKIAGGRYLAQKIAGARFAEFPGRDHPFWIGDADPIVFLNYVAQGIKNIEPDFGEALFPYLSEANDELLQFPERAADLLINEILRSIEQPFVLVLDDYHHIGTDTIVHKIVDRILQYASEHLHLIITTRDLPPLAIMRLRTQSAGNPPMSAGCLPKTGR